MAKDSDHTLSLAFMRGHPAQAAQVLELLPANEVAGLLEQTPARLGSAVLAAMQPHRAAGCIGVLSDARALELMAPMGTQPSVALLRHLAEPRRRLLIAGLPTATALASALLLGFAEDTVGAWADPDVIILPAETLASHALERMRQITAYPLVFVADNERRLAGIVELGALLQAPDGATLASLMHSPDHVLAAYAPLSAAPAHPGWERRSTLPVVEPGGHLVGVMTRDALARALHRTAPQPANDAGRTTLRELFAKGYWHALTGMLQGGLLLLPKVSPIEENRDER